MNFLAHLHLAPATPAGWIGGLAPDLARKAELRDCDPALHEAIEQHRRIDAFTDTHPIFHRTRARLFPACGRFAGIVTDVLYDHVLARDWARHDDRPLEDFLDEVHAALALHADLMPPTMRVAARRMHRQRWLASYATVEGIESVLRRMEARLSARFARDVRLAHAAHELVRLEAPLSADFHDFYPRLRARCGLTAPTASCRSR